MTGIIRGDNERKANEYEKKNIVRTRKNSVKKRRRGDGS